MLKTESQRLQRYFHNPIIRGNVGKLSATHLAMCPQVPSSHTLSYPAQPSGAGGLLTAVLGMERAVTRQDLGPQHGQKMTIKCVASIYTAYYKTTEVTVAFRPKRKYRRRQQAETTLGGGNSKHRGQDHQKGNILASAGIKMMKARPNLIGPRPHQCLLCCRRCKSTCGSWQLWTLWPKILCSINLAEYCCGYNTSFC